MESWARYRNVATLIVVIVAQLILLGYQVRRGDDMTLLRAWIVGAVTPVNKLFHGGFGTVSDVWTGYVWPHDFWTDYLWPHHFWTDYFWPHYFWTD